MADEIKTQVVNESPAQDAGKPQPEAQVAEEERFDAEYVKKLRAEAAQNSILARELKQKLDEYENAKLSETERLQKKLAELEREAAEKARALQERTTEYEVKLKAANLGIVDPEAAWRLLDTAAIEFDEDGKPKNIEALLKALVKERPWLTGANSQQGIKAGAGNGSAGKAQFTMNDFIRRSSGRK